MLDINLLPPEYGPGKVVTPANLIIIALCSLICLSLIMSSLRLLTTVQDYSLRLKYHEDQIELYRRQVEDIHALAKRVQLLSTRLDLVAELLQEKASWSDKFIELSRCVPQYGAWVRTLTVERPQAARRAVAPGQPGAAAPRVDPVLADISGDVASIDKVSQFVAKLEESDTFGTITFDTMTNDPAKAGTESPVSFTFSVEILNSKGDF